MGMTMTQKILAKHAGLESVRAGQLIQAKLDLVLGNDITTPVAINEFESAGFEKVFDKSRIAMVMDHFAPTRTSSPPRSASSAAPLPAASTSTTSTMSARWASSTRCCPSRGLSPRARP